MSATTVGDELWARAVASLGREPATEDEALEVLSGLAVQTPAIPDLPNLAVKIRALQLRNLDPTLPSTTARLVAEAELASPQAAYDAVGEVLVSATDKILASRGKAPGDCTYEQYGEALSEAARTLAGGRS